MSKYLCICDYYPRRIDQEAECDIIMKNIIEKSKGEIQRYVLAQHLKLHISMLSVCH